MENLYLLPESKTVFHFKHGSLFHHDFRKNLISEFKGFNEKVY
jgi:hypothetical protein